MCVALRALNPAEAARSKERAVSVAAGKGALQVTSWHTMGDQRRAEDPSRASHRTFIFGKPLDQSFAADSATWKAARWKAMQEIWPVQKTVATAIYAENRGGFERDRSQAARPHSFLRVFSP